MSTSSVSTTSVNSASSLQTMYLNLLITQLKNQDPTNPTDSSQMVSQLAQLSSLEQQENLNTSFSQVLKSTQMNQATWMIGTQVSFLPDGADSVVSATVEGVEVDNGTVYLKAGDYKVEPANVLSISVPKANTGTNS